MAERGAGWQRRWNAQNVILLVDVAIIGCRGMLSNRPQSDWMMCTLEWFTVNFRWHSIIDTLWLGFLSIRPSCGNVSKWIMFDCSTGVPSKCKQTNLSNAVASSSDCGFNANVWGKFSVRVIEVQPEPIERNVFLNFIWFSGYSFVVAFAGTWSDDMCWRTSHTATVDYIYLVWRFFLLLRSPHRAIDCVHARAPARSSTCMCNKYTRIAYASPIRDICLHIGFDCRHRPSDKSIHFTVFFLSLRLSQSQRRLWYYSR